MIHVATVHWRTDRWIDVQLRFLDRFLGEPYRVYAFLTEVPGDHEHKFFYTSTESIKEHAVKLNLLGDVISFAADDPEDVLIFLDGDAFPVAPLQPFARDLLDHHSLIAVRRDENLGDVQPHPCFCMTTVGFWNELGGDWKPGHEWKDVSGKALTDVGGNLLDLLERAKVYWYPLRRMNVRNPHPILFGFYGDTERGAVVYHHGAGFRGRPERVARLEADEPKIEVTFLAKAIDHLLKYCATVSRWLYRFHPVTRLEERLAVQEERLADPVFAQIERDEDFRREFM
jgi:hypothetical protein